MTKLRFVLFLLFVVFLMFPALAVAAELRATTQQTLVLPPAQLYAVLIGLVTPLIGYITNAKFWKAAPEQVKTVVQLFITTVTSAIYVAAATPTFGWNNSTLQLIVTTVVAGLAAHFGYRATGINQKLGARSHLAQFPAPPPVPQP